MNRCDLDVVAFADGVLPLLLLAAMYRIGTKAFVVGLSPIRRPIPGHAFELALDGTVGLRTRRNRQHHRLGLALNASFGTTRVRGKRWFSSNRKNVPYQPMHRVSLCLIGFSFYAVVSLAMLLRRPSTNERCRIAFVSLAAVHWPVLKCPPLVADYHSHLRCCSHCRVSLESLFYHRFPTHHRYCSSIH